MNKRRLCLAVVFFIFTAICSVALILAKSDVKTQKAIVVTDTAGKIYRLLEYGVVYAPGRNNTLSDSIREYVIIQDRDDWNKIVEKVLWNDIHTIEVKATDRKGFTITLKDGKVLQEGALRRGNLVGITDSGENIVRHITIQVKNIEVPDNKPKVKKGEEK